ncbi:GNAT family N-acetyltransferase [Phaeobacter sp. HF9A]|uniref:GNAT family N-acetyltransferase n=1 Tax=Phaeobacter sp. HF9A TaxID=2721561 RepID=UPI00142F6F7C|nr:GNAT family N-acetyltransferase [Phaeobacter sp. HF9A]NIZ14816.1 GNAT family N-acetyltransferase [Phaeobacter sp. HF9A]
MIRPYTPSDKPTVLHIWRQANAQAHPFLSQDLTDQAEAMIRDSFLDMAETWIIEEGSRPLGFLSLLENEVGGLFVLPEAQGKGLGRALLDHARERRPTLTLSVFVKNHRARRFYAAYGFQPLEERQNAFFKEPELALHLTR